MTRTGTVTRTETATRTAARLSEVRVSPILEIERAAAALRDRGVDVIALGTGEPDFDTPAHIVEAAERAMRGGRTRYTRLDGAPETKEAVCAKFERENGLRFSADEISVSTGAKQVLFNAFAATLDPGDEVLIPTPAWTSYADIVRINGGRAVFVPTRAADGFAPTAEAISRAIGPRTRWLLLNSPSNPTGAVLSPDALRAVAEALEPHPDVLVLVDEIYEHLCFDAPFRSFGDVCPSLRERTLLVNGVSKAYAMTGWRLGYGAGPAWLIRAMAKVQSQTTSCPSSISQAAAVAALTETDPGFDARRDAYRRRRDRVVRTLDAIERRLVRDARRRVLRLPAARRRGGRRRRVSLAARLGARGHGARQRLRGARPRAAVLRRGRRRARARPDPRGGGLRGRARRGGPFHRTATGGRA